MKNLTLSLFFLFSVSLSFSQEKLVWHEDLNKAIEIISVRVNKGVAISRLLKNNYDFIICLGDDISDEYMFNNLPKDSFSIKVGNKNTLPNKNIP